MRVMAEPKKNKIAQGMVAMRWAKTTKEQRSELARQLNAARWGKKKKKKTA
jgi:hypothetical protein